MQTGTPVQRDTALVLLHHLQQLTWGTRALHIRQTLHCGMVLGQQKACQQSAAAPTDHSRRLQKAACSTNLQTQQMLLQQASKSDLALQLPPSMLQKGRKGTSQERQQVHMEQLMDVWAALWPICGKSGWTFC